MTKPRKPLIDRLREYAYQDTEGYDYILTEAADRIEELETQKTAAEEPCIWVETAKSVSGVEYDTGCGEERTIHYDIWAEFPKFCQDCGHEIEVHVYE